MKYKSFKIEKYKGIDIDEFNCPLEIKIQKGKSVAIIGVNECGKSTILKAICAFDFRNDKKENQYKHLQVLKNRNKSGNSTQNAVITASFELEQSDIRFLLNYFNENELFTKNSIEDSKEDGETKLIEKSDEEKIDILWKVFRFFSIKCELTRNESNQIIRKYSILTKPSQAQSVESNIDINKLSTVQQDMSKQIINFMPTMLYITDLPDFYSDNDFSKSENERHEECKTLINNLFISGSINSLTVNQVFELYKKDQSEYNAALNQVEHFLNTEFSNRWNQFGLNDSFGQLDIQLSCYPDSKKINISVKEKGQSGNSFYPIDERSMGFQWFFKFVMNISFNPLKENGILFLIDEPGTYLHESAQTILSKELNSMLHDNYMIFSTHYYSMLNLQEIELNRIYVIERNPRSIIATKATDYQGYSEESKKSPILPILNAFRKTVIDYIKFNNAKKILIVEGLNDKYAISVFCTNPKWSNVEIFPSVGATQIADNIAEFAYYNSEILALFDKDNEGFSAMKNIKSKTNAMTLELKDNKYDLQETFVMDDLFVSDELKNLSAKLNEDGIENFGTYKDVMRILYENKNLVEKYKSILTKTLENFKNLENVLLTKMKLLKK